ncbi:MAG: glycoside hydrolase family 43 protein, partial [Bacteroidota bacterium]
MILLFAKINGLSIANNQAIIRDSLLNVSEIRIRDPFIFADQKSQTYYLYASISNRLDDSDQMGVEVYTSKDLINWTPPKSVLALDDDHWARKSVWAPEVHYYQGAYYLFVTLTSEKKISDTPNAQNGAIQWKRGTHIFKSTTPFGPFEALQKGAHTPSDWMSLDGTLCIENGKPYMVFCHEWAQIFDGSIDVVELTTDLSKTIEQPKQLFKASDAKWVKNMKAIGYKQNGLVTDGPFLYKNNSGELIMIWSSFGTQQYAIGQAISKSGSVFGPWHQLDELLVDQNGGHGMLFYTFDHQLMLTYHSPNSRGLERLHLTAVRENDQGLLSIPAKTS